MPGWDEIFRMANASNTASGAGTPSDGRVPRLGGGAIGNNNRLRIRTLAPEAEKRRQRADSATSIYDAALADPTGTAGLFGDFFDQRAHALTSEATRDYGRQIGGVTANIASRFGGNASSYEQTQANRFTEESSRNLNEILAGMAPQQAQLGLQYTGELGNAANAAEGNYSNALQILMASLDRQRQGEKDQKKNSLGGTLLGAGLGLATKLAGPISVGM